MLSGLLGACAVLLAAAGVLKLRSPAPAAEALSATRLPGSAVLSTAPVLRLTGLLEVAVAAAVLGAGGRIAAALLAASWLLLAVVAVALLRRAPATDCGCFGNSGAPVTIWHVAVNLAATAISLAALCWPPPSMVAELALGGLPAVLLPATVVLLAWLGYLLLTALPELLTVKAKMASR